MDQASDLLASAKAIAARISVNISSSVPEFFIMLKAMQMNLQFPGTYPREESILSMLGESIWWRLSPGSIGSPVSSQLPVHFDSAHSLVSENSSPLFFALRLALRIRFFAMFFKYPRRVYTSYRSGFFARHSSAYFSRFSRFFSRQILCSSLLRARVRSKYSLSKTAMRSALRFLYSRRYIRILSRFFSYQTRRFWFAMAILRSSVCSIAESILSCEVPILLGFPQLRSKGAQ